MTFCKQSIEIFNQAINDYHQFDNVDTPINNPFQEKSIEFYLYLKKWIDTVQWHLEDIIRDPAIDPVEALQIKRRIDRSNQERTDLVEMIDSYFLQKFANHSRIVDSFPDVLFKFQSAVFKYPNLQIDLVFFRLGHLEPHPGTFAEIHLERLAVGNFIFIEKIKDEITAGSQVSVDVLKDLFYVRKGCNVVYGITGTGHKIKLLLRPIGDHIRHIEGNLGIILPGNIDHEIGRAHV